MCIELINKNTIRHSTVFCNRLMSRRDVSTFFLFFKLNVAIKWKYFLIFILMSYWKHHVKNHLTTQRFRYSNLDRWRKDAMSLCCYYLLFRYTLLHKMCTAIMAMALILIRLSLKQKTVCLIVLFTLKIKLH